MALLGMSRSRPSSSLYKHHIGEMHFIPTKPDSTFNLPRTGGVSFCVQESWVQNDTIRDNILFNSPYEEDRYQKGSSTYIFYFALGSLLMISLQFCISVLWKRICSFLRLEIKRKSANAV